MTTEEIQQLQSAFDVVGNAYFVLGIIVGAFGLYILEFLLGEFVNPWLYAFMRREKEKRGIDCHCDECEERARMGIDQ